MLRLITCSLLFLGLSSSTIFAQTEFRLGVEVKDKYSQKSLVPIISVLEINTEFELKGKMIDGFFVVNVKPNTQYQVLVALQDYKTYRQIHTFDQSASPKNGIHPFGIDLEPTNRPKIPSTNGVEPEPTGTVLSKASESTTKPTLSTTHQELKFAAVDAQTNQPIAALFKLSDEIKESFSGSSKADGSSLTSMVAIQSRPYKLVVTANGYRRHESVISLSSPLASNQTLRVIKLTKSDAILKIRIFDAQTSQPLLANLRILDQTDKKMALDVKNTPNGQAALPINPNHSYKIEAEAKGFMPYQQALEKVIPVLNESNELIIKLAKIGDANLQLTAINATTGKPIAAVFRITPSQTEQTTELKGASVPLKFKIAEPDIYHIEAIAAGYQTQQHDIDAQEIGVGQVFQYEAKLIPEVAKPAKAISKIFTFKVFDAQTQKPINKPSLKVKNAISRQVLIPKTEIGGAQISLQTDQDYLLDIEATGYEPVSMKMETATWAKRGEFLTNIALVPLKKEITATKSKSVVNEKIFDNIKSGQSVSIEDNVYFDQSSYILRQEAHGQLSRLAVIMVRNPDIKIEIVGHTDNIGDQRLNMILSEQRAKVIANYLRNQGVNEARIGHRGEGSSRPMAPNDSEENRQRNRRVQFLIK